MAVPSVSLTQVDGGLSVLPPSLGRPLAVVGQAAAGDYVTPVLYTRTKTLIAAHTAGPAVEAACYAIEKLGVPVLFVRERTTTSGSYSDLDTSGVAGTSVATNASSTHPRDDYDAVVTVVAGGTIGVSGITYTTSLDGGRTTSAVTALGTAAFLIIPDSGGARVNFAAGTLVAGDVITFRCVAPQGDADDLDEALQTLVATSRDFAAIEVVGSLTGSKFSTIADALASLRALGRYRYAIGHARTPNVDETDAEYQDAMETAFSASADTGIIVCAGACLTTSSVTRQVFRRPPSFAFAARQADLDIQVNAAEIDLGPLPGVSIADSNGNPVYHDEMLSPGLDALRFCALRSWPGRVGVFVNRPRVMSATDSDYTIAPYVAVMDVFNETLQRFLERRLSRRIIVSLTTGHIRESEALEIEQSATAQLLSVLSGKVSGVSVALSRTDNLLAGAPLTGDARCIPLAYPESIALTTGFSNPAASVQGV